MGKLNQSCFIRKLYIKSSYASSRSLLTLNCYADCIGIQQPSMCGEDNLSNYSSRGLVSSHFNCSRKDCLPVLMSWQEHSNKGNINEYWVPHRIKMSLNAFLRFICCLPLCLVFVHRFSYCEWCCDCCFQVQLQRSLWVISESSGGCGASSLWVFSLP